MRKQFTVLAAIAAGIASVMLQAPMAHAQPGDTLVPDDTLAACFADAIGDATGTTPDWASNGITQDDIDAWAAAGGVSMDGFACNGVSVLTGIDKLPYTRTSDDSLDLIYGSITDLSPLAGLTNLTVLELAGNNIADITPLAGLTNLSELYLSNNKISDLSPLAKMKQMYHLELVDNWISDVTPLAGMTKLYELRIESNSVTSISPIAWLPGLHNLYLGGNPIADPSAIATFTHLSFLGLANTGASDISWLGSMSSLTYLDIQGNTISDISPLAKLTKLNTIYASDNQISDISVLAGMTKLNNITLDGNPLGDLLPLAGLKRVYYLNLSNTGISDLSPLASMSHTVSDQTVYIFVTGNHIADISPLDPCTQAQSMKNSTKGCTLVYAQIQTLEQTAVVDIPQALPTVIGQSDDPVQWTITQGTPAPVIADGQVTFSAPGTYAVQFQDQPGGYEDDSYWFDATPDICAHQNGQWNTTTNQCGVDGDFTGMVTYTVGVPVAEPSDTPSVEDSPDASDSTGANGSTGGSVLMGGLIAGGVVLVVGAAAILIWWRRRGRHEATQQVAA